MTRAQSLFSKLNGSGILSASGQINFNFMGTSTCVRDRNVVGNIIQSWLEKWMSDNSIDFDKNLNTQESPDFYLNLKNKKVDLLEVKCFYKNANFDVGNFLGYCTELEKAPHKLNADYLIFSYDMSNVGDVTIKNIWLKKVWEICGPSGSHKIKVQAKKGQIFNIRPISWYSNKTKFKPFNNELLFLRALNATLQTGTGNHLYARGWLKTVQSGYETFTGKKLT